MDRHGFRRVVSSGLSAACALLLAACSTTDARASSLRPVYERSRSAPVTPDTPVDRYMMHVSVLAHDALEGRAIGSDGIDMAAGYIAGQFAAAGLEPGGPDASYFQEFTIEQDPEIGANTKLHFETDTGRLEAHLDTDFVPFNFSSQDSFRGDVVFVGYGITNPDEGHDDYRGIDVERSVVLMLRREPPGFDADGHTHHARFDRKVPLAVQRGAVAVLIANQKSDEDDDDELMRFGPRSDHGIPAIHVTRKLADRLLGAGGLSSLAELQKQLDEDGTNVSAPLGSVRAAGNVEFEPDEIVGRNVIGVLPGTGMRHDEYVVIGAHYDHVGVRHGEIYNGADDNASGTAGVIELARTFTDVSERDRSIIFMAFTGEETGLHGSRHFVSHPTVPLDSIAAMINLDMIGRVTEHDRDNMLAIQGLGTGESFRAIVENRTKEAGIEFLPEASALGPSDHASFYLGGVPSLFFFTGVHEDYHQPTDDTEKINAEGAAKIVDLVAAIAMDLVNDEQAPVFAEVNRRADVFRSGQSMRRVVMGVMPDMDDDSGRPGWRIARVFPGSGADRAGMKPGDRVVSIEGKTIGGLADYREVIRGKKPGDVINVTVLRDVEERTLDVELSGSGD
ncbi:MAG: M20/M25/M40 family metallo-hydrolase [Phycisphaerae bacterium]